MSELPERWTETTVDVVCEKLRGVSYDKNEASREVKDGLVPILRANNIDGDHLTFVDLVFVPGARVSEKQKLQLNDVVVAMSSGSKSVVGKTAQVLEDWHGSFGAFCGVLRPTPQIDGRYFGYFFRTKEYRAKVSELSAGTNINNLKNEHFGQLDLPVPPLNEQRRIVAKLEKLLSRVDAAQARLAIIPRILKRFRQSVLAAACSGRLTADWRIQNPVTGSITGLLKRIAQRRIQSFEDECKKAARLAHRKPRRPSNLEPSPRSNDDAQELPESWFWLSFEDAASSATYSMSSGPFGSALGRKDYRESGVPVVRGQNIQSGKFVLSNFVYIAEKKAAELERSTAYPRDIIVVAVGSSGESAMVPDELPIAVLSQNCNKITLDDSVSLPEFVNLSLQIENSLAQLQDRTTDTARPFLSLTNLKTLLLPIAPLTEQQEIVRRVEALFKTADALEARYRKAKAHVDKLTQSILARAFRGELVPQDPNDESASALLERIRKMDKEKVSRKIAGPKRRRASAS